MLFKESFITNAGAELLARAATEGSGIVWTRAATSNADTDGYGIAAMNALTDITKNAGDSYTSTGAVTNAIITDARDSVSIYCELTNDEHSGEARTFGAWAKIRGDENEVLAVVARCGGATPTTINPASDGRVKAFVDFTLKISGEQVQAVEVSETNYYATNAALQSEQTARLELASMVVTTHRKDSTEQGDDQKILGSKTFADAAYFTSIMPNKEEIVITGYDDSVEHINRIKKIREIFNIGQAEAKVIADGVKNAVDQGDSYTIAKELYDGQTTAEVADKLKTFCGYTCANGNASIGSDSNRFESLHAEQTNTGRITNNENGITIDDYTTLNKRAQFEDGLRVEKKYIDEYYGNEGKVVLMADAINGGTYPGARLTVQKNNRTYGINVGEGRTWIEGPFEVESLHAEQTNTGRITNDGNGISIDDTLTIGDDTGIAQLDKTGLKFKVNDTSEAKTSLTPDKGLKAQKAEVLTAKIAKAECGKLFPASDGTEIVITQAKETSAGYPNSVQILRSITNASEGAIRERLLLLEQGSALTLTNEPIQENYTPPGVIIQNTNALAINCTIAEAKTALGTSGTAFVYTVENKTTIGNSTRPFGAVHANQIHGALNKATGILASLYGNDVGALVEITITGGVNGAITRPTEGVLPRGTIIRSGHKYDASGAEDPDVFISPPLLTVTITCESMSITNNMRFALLKKTEINIPANTLSATAKAWAIRVE